MLCHRPFDSHKFARAFSILPLFRPTPRSAIATDFTTQNVALLWLKAVCKTANTNTPLAQATLRAPILDSSFRPYHHNPYYTPSPSHTSVSASLSIVPLGRPSTLAIVSTAETSVPEVSRKLGLLSTGKSRWARVLDYSTLGCLA